MGGGEDLQYLRLKPLSRIAAFVAAYMLVIQSLIGAFALGAAAASPLLDAFGNPLCITSTDSPAGQDRGTHSDVPDCCTIACSKFASTSADERNADTLSALGAVSLDLPLPAFDAGDLVSHLWHPPGSPRSPPFAV